MNIIKKNIKKRVIVAEILKFEMLGVISEKSLEQSLIICDNIVSKKQKTEYIYKGE